MSEIEPLTIQYLLVENKDFNHPVECNTDSHPALSVALNITSTEGVFATVPSYKNKQSGGLRRRHNRYSGMEAFYPI